MPIADPSLHRTSGCPVHFLWDGRGKGRALVRAGFLGFSVAGGAWVLGFMSHTEVAMDAGLVVAGVAGATWGVGQALSALALRAWKRSLPRKA